MNKSQFELLTDQMPFVISKPKFLFIFKNFNSIPLNINIVPNIIILIENSMITNTKIRISCWFMLSQIFNH